MGRRPKNYVPPHPPILVECTRCGENKAETEFYSNRQSRIYNVKKQVPLCKDCVQTLLEEYSHRYSERAAVFALCGTLDIPFIPELYKKIVATNSQFVFGKFIRALQINQYRTESFISSIASKDLSELKQANPKAYTTNERLNRLQEDFSSLREELHGIKAQFAYRQNAHE